MDDLKHLREVLDEAYPREELSLDALARVVFALEGLSSAALDGGWTFKGFTAWAQALEDKISLLKAELESSRAVAPLSECRRMQIIGDEFPLPLVQPAVIAKVDSVCLAIEKAHGIGS